MKNSYLSEMTLIDVTDRVKIIGRALHNPIEIQNICVIIPLDFMQT